MHSEGTPHHLGINYILAPIPIIDKSHYLKFQQSLVDAGIDFDQSRDKPAISVVRQSPLLEIVVANLKDAPVGQLLVVSPGPSHTSDGFGKEVEAIVKAFQNTWERPRQIVSCDITIRYLYDASSEHAFQELWETRLGQPRQSLSVFGRNVLGGGIRFVMPPMPNESDPTEVEVKIESYLQDTKKLYVEVIFRWLQPQPPGSPFTPMERLKIVDRFIDNEVANFMMENPDDHR